MDDTPEERFRQHEALLRSLAAILQIQYEMNQRHAEMTREHAARHTRLDVLIEQQAEFNRDVKTTLARIETLLARKIRPEDNGTKA